MLALLATSGPAAAKPKRITGKLSEPGYTVFALAGNGKATSVQGSTGRFRIVPPARRVSLHLRAVDGTYAGPVVIGKERQGKRAIVGIRAGAKLGEVEVKAARGFAKLAEKLPEESLNTEQRARARKGVPIGAGASGLARSKPRAGVVPGDPDLDGVPDQLDVDDDGDTILDNLDLSAAGGGAQAAQTEAGCGPLGPGSSFEFHCHTVHSSLAPSRFEDTVNVNAGSGIGQINDALETVGHLRFSPLNDSAELDCGGEDPGPGNPEGWIGGRPYCVRGGSGVVFGGPFAGSPFPGPPGGQFDPDGDGFGTFPKPSFLAPRADTTEIKTGDVLTQRVDGIEEVFPTVLGFVFVTGPALVSYSDGAGNCAQVSGTGSCGTEFSYPVPAGGLGTMGNGFPVAPCPADAPPPCVAGDVVLTLTFWRPQRQAIPDSTDPPTAQWMDIGHLNYAVGPCPQNAFTPTDPNELAPPAVPLSGGGSLEDQEGDQASSPGNTFTFILNLSRCGAVQSGEENLNFLAVSGGIDTAQQSMWFKLK